MIELDLVDIRKTSLRYFANNVEAIQKKGLVRASIKLKSVDIEDENGEKIQTPRIVNIKLDLLFLDINNEKKTNTEYEFKDDEVLARLKFTMKVTVDINIDKIFEEDDLHKEILYITEPYIHKEIKDFCDEIEIPKFSLPLRFWES